MSGRPAGSYYADDFTSGFVALCVGRCDLV